jgi:hypothetical protein
MNALRKALILVLGLAAISFLVAVSISGSSAVRALPPTRFFGTIAVNGAQPPLNTIVRAKIDNQICGEGRVSEVAGFFIGYTVDVNSSANQAGCGDFGEFDVVTFEWVGSNGEVVNCSPRGVWDPSAFQQLHLTCNESGQQVSDSEWKLLRSWNFGLWNLEGCRSAQEAFQPLVDPGVLDIAWKFLDETQSWEAFAPAVPTSVNSLQEVCSGDILGVHVSSGVVWEER